MGFKDLVARNNYEYIKLKLERLSRFIASNTEENSGMLYSMFSDSIILFTNGENDEIFAALLTLTRKIVEESISLGLPIKGAIAKGLCTVSMGPKPFYFGQPIIDAYSLEENVILYGVVLHHTVEEFAVKQQYDHLVFDYSVPLKGGKSNHYVLNWVGEAKDKAQNIDNLKNIRKTVSDSPRRYIDNTLICFDS